MIAKIPTKPSEKVVFVPSNCLPVHRPDPEVLAPADILQDHCALLEGDPPPPLGCGRVAVGDLYGRFIVKVTVTDVVLVVGDQSDAVHLLREL